MTVLFGKYFENHGPLENNLMYHIPDFSNIQSLKYGYLKPYNQQERVDYKIEINFSKLKIIEDVIIKNNIEDLSKINICCRFYNNSLKIFEKEPELSYLNLINSLEVLSGMLDFSDDEKFSHDEKLNEYFKLFKDKLNNSDSIISYFKNRLYQIKRKVTLIIMKYLDSKFLNSFEGSFDNEFYKITEKNKDTLIKNSYDLRSEYIHNGQYFGNYIFPIKDDFIVEVITIEKNNKNTQLLTFMGLERIVRYCILQYINENVIKLD